MRRYLLTLSLMSLILSIACSPALESNSVVTNTKTTLPTTPVTTNTSISGISTTTKPSKETAQVIRVIDGDTIVVSINRTEYTVRYIGIDAPETVKPNSPVEPFGTEASTKNKELVDGKVVLLEKDVSETDQYGRLLRYVYVGDLFVNAELVRLGYAQAISYPPDIKYQDLLLSLQGEARVNGRGLWSIK
jgi:micrococcal nuclease